MTSQSNGPLPGPIRLRDGTTVLLRPIEPTDGPALVRFHEGLSDRTSHRRFFNVHPHLSAAEVIRFSTVDHVDREAVVLIAEGDIIAVGRFDREPGSPTAEVAFVVSDSWQGRGAGTLLLVYLTDWARQIGVSQLEADTLSDNREMIHVFNRSGIVTSTQFDQGVLHLTLTLDVGPSV